MTKLYHPSPRCFISILLSVYGKLNPRFHPAKNNFRKSNLLKPAYSIRLKSSKPAKNVSYHVKHVKPVSFSGQGAKASTDWQRFIPHFK
jgi:hypothetical protein